MPLALPNLLSFVSSVAGDIFLPLIATASPFPEVDGDVGRLVGRLLGRDAGW